MINTPFCTRCNTFYAIPEYSDDRERLCANCWACAYCMSKKAVRDQVCDECRCKSCDKPRFQDNKHGDLCNACWMAKNPDKVCQACKRVIATAMFKGDKKPKLCTRCARGVMGERETCYFCDSPFSEWKSLTGKNLYYAACFEHFSVYSCGKNRCWPTKPCESCRSVAPAAPANTHDDGHQANNPACPCRLCRNFQRRNTFYFRNPRPAFWIAYRAVDRKKNRSARLLGPEVEIVGAENYEARQGIADVARKWGMSGIVTDASLRTDEGFEVCMAPAAGDFFLRQADELEEALIKAGSYVNERCGLHIHIDARDHAYSDVEKLALACSMTEPAWIRTQPYDRVMGERSHCAPMGDRFYELLVRKEPIPPKESKEVLVRSIYSGRNDARWIGRKPPRTNHGNDRQIEARYYWLNFHSYFYRGTFEVRLHTGTTQAKKIKTWGMTWANFVDKIYSMTEAQIRKLAKENPDPVDLLVALLPSQSAEYVLARIKKFGPEYGPLPLIHF